MEKVVPSSNQSLFTRKEAADKLRISLVTLDNLIKKKKLLSVIIGRRRLITQEELNSFINKGGSK